MLKSIIIFSKNIDKSTAFYTSLFNFKIIKNSNIITEMIDKNNIIFIIKKVQNECFLSSGYSPLLNFRVDNIDFIKNKLISNNIDLDGDIEYYDNMKILSFRNPDNIMISVYETNIDEIDNNYNLDKKENPINNEISNLLKKIKH